MVVHSIVVHPIVVHPIVDHPMVVHPIVDYPIVDYPMHWTTMEVKRSNSLIKIDQLTNFIFTFYYIIRCTSLLIIRPIEMFKITERMRKCI